MAEGLLNFGFEHSPELRNEMIVKSCGLAALVDQSADEIAVDLMQAKGIDISTHRAQQLELSHVLWADLILVMESCHRDEILSCAPSSRGKVFRLGHFSDIDIHDPYRKPRAIYAEALKLIETSVSEWIHETMQTRTDFRRSNLKNYD